MSEPWYNAFTENPYATAGTVVGAVGAATLPPLVKVMRDDLRAGLSFRDTVSDWIEPNKASLASVGAMMAAAPVGIAYDRMRQRSTDQNIGEGSIQFSPMVGKMPAQPPMRTDSMTEYKPTLRDRLGSYVAGDGNDPWRQNLAQVLFSSRGMGDTGHVGLGSMTGYNAFADAYDNVERGRYGHAALNAVDGALSASGMKSLPYAAEALRKPILKHAPESFERAFTLKNGQPARVTGEIERNGTTANVSGVFADERWKGGAGTMGHSGMRQVFREIQDQFPYVSHITANRISGARQGPASKGTDGMLDLKINPGWRALP
jgi:hypothetical protein